MLAREIGRDNLFHKQNGAKVYRFNIDKLLHDCMFFIMSRTYFRVNPHAIAA